MYICVPTQQHELNTSEMSDQSLLHPKTSWFEKNGLFIMVYGHLQVCKSFPL